MMSAGGYQQPGTIYQQPGTIYQQPGTTYQQPGTTVVVVQQPMYGTRRWNNMGPSYLRNGVQMGGVLVGSQFILCLGVFGFMLTLAGTIFVATDADQEFWSRFDKSVGPPTIIGSILLVVGLLMLIGCGIMSFVAKKKFEQYRAANRDNPGQVISPPPPGTYPQQPPGTYPQQPPGTYPQQPPHFPGQPSGAAPYGMNPGTQMPPNPESSYGGDGQMPSYYPPPTEFKPPVNDAVNSQPPTGTDMSNEYNTPPAYAPGYEVNKQS